MRRWLGLAFLLALVILSVSEYAPSAEKSAVSRVEMKARPSDWSWEQRTFPHGTWSPTAFRRAMNESKAMGRFSKRGSALGEWQPAGPTNIGGRITDVEFVPTDPDQVYAGSATGGVFKSTDTGRTWEPVFDEVPNLQVGDIAVDPNDADIVYVGTGEANPSANNHSGGGLYKSTDAGATWTASGLENTFAVGRIRIDPTNSDRIFVAATGSYFGTNPERGVYRSEDGGATWTQVLFVSDSTAAIDLVMNPEEPDILYAAMWERVRRPGSALLSGPTSGLYRTTDGGDTWELLASAQGLPDATEQSVGRIGLAISESDPDILYALFTDGLNYLRLYKTTDGGDTWGDADPNNEIWRRAGLDFSWYFGQIRIHPTNPDIVYLLDVFFMRSTDSGQTWTFLRGTNSFHVDHHALAFHPENPDYVIGGNDGGLNISEDAGVNWVKVEHLPITQFYSVAIDPVRPYRLYGGTQDNATMRTFTGDPDAWEILNLGFGAGGDGLNVLVSETDTTTIYAASQFGVLHKSSNSGDTFAEITRFGIAPLYENEDSFPGSEPRNWKTPVVLDPNNNAMVYYGTNRVYRSETRGTSWRPISESLTDWTWGSGRFGTLTTIAVAPSNSNVLYAGADDGNVWVTQDFGETWTHISADLPYRWVTQIAVDPHDEQIAYVTFSGLQWQDPEPHIFRTTDAGQTWEDISSNLPSVPINAVVVDPVGSNRLYIGTDAGAFVSFDTGDSWEVLGTGLPATPVYDLQLHAEERFLIAGTHGRSIYKLDLPSVVTDVSEELPNSVLDAFELDPNYPNPFRFETTLSFRLNRQADIHLAIYDVLGREVRTLIRGHRTAGSYTVRWNGQDDAGRPLANGAYFYRLADQTGAVATRRMVIAR